jgi:hypothetical protein
MATDSASDEAELHGQHGSPPSSKERDEAAAKHMNTTGHSYQACTSDFRVIRTSGHSNQKKVVLTNHASPQRGTEEAEASADEKNSKYEHWTTHPSVCDSDAGEKDNGL